MIFLLFKFVVKIVDCCLLNIFLIRLFKFWKVLLWVYRWSCKLIPDYCQRMSFIFSHNIDACNTVKPSLGPILTRYFYTQYCNKTILRSFDYFEPWVWMNNQVKLLKIGLSFVIKNIKCRIIVLSQYCVQKYLVCKIFNLNCTNTKSANNEEHRSFM